MLTTSVQIDSYLFTCNLNSIETIYKCSSTIASRVIVVVVAAAERVDGWARNHQHWYK
jgi:hypothetical protein